MALSARLIRDARMVAGLTQSELARRSSTSQPAVAAYESGAKVPTVDTLERLLRAAGMEVSVRPSPGSDVGTPLRRLIHERRDEILREAARHHAANVRVFGSVARGEETERSDVDILLDLEPGRSLLDLVRLRRALSRLLGVNVDVVTTGGLRESDRATILRDAVPI
ncbi:MAG: XRE family transcriptional regulator [Actinobacteria bacterium]|nr:XRE family transcriptional regulator [Actinomycetota bacterium]